MTRKKSGFLTFCFSLIPGAGEMYMGFMKQGLSIMAVFWLLVFFATFFNLGPVLFILPILWCYSFFNVHNIRGMSDEEFYALEDDYLFHLDENSLVGKLKGKQSNLLAWGLIIVGVAILWNYVIGYIRWLMPDEIYWSVMDGVPQVAIAVLLIWCGIYLIRGKKKELDSREKEHDGWKDVPVKKELADKYTEQKESGDKTMGQEG